MKINNLIIIAILILLIIPLTSSLGITPGRTTLDYEPGAEQIIPIKTVYARYMLKFFLSISSVGHLLHLIAAPREIVEDLLFYQQTVN